MFVSAFNTSGWAAAGLAPDASASATAATQTHRMVLPNLSESERGHDPSL
jgi:hypothetical protein